MLSIVDLGQNYYLVTFSCEEHHQTTLIKGTWLIYDHYLTLHEWSPNLCPSNDIIEQLVVWVCISSLPIEYYDQTVLTFIGNFTGKAIKVDKKSLPMEGGSMRDPVFKLIFPVPSLLCLLLKLVTTQWSIKASISCVLVVGNMSIMSRIIRITFMLNMTRKIIRDIRHNEAKGGISKPKSQAIIKGLWMFVKKTRRRKINNIVAILNTILKKGMKETSKSRGSRYLALLEEWEDRNMDTTVRQERKEDPSYKDKISSCKDK